MIMGIFGRYASKLPTIMKPPALGARAEGRAGRIPETLGAPALPAYSRDQ